MKYAVVYAINNNPKLIIEEYEFNKVFNRLYDLKKDAHYSNINVCLIPDDTLKELLTLSVITYDTIKPYIIDYQEEFLNFVDYIIYNEEIHQGMKPIYEILVFEHPNKELIYPTGKHSGFPDIGASDSCGYYYNVEDSIYAVMNNVCDIREYVYDAAFVICRFPGLYDAPGKEARLYFKWDSQTESFVNEAEPAIFTHVSY